MNPEYFRLALRNLRRRRLRAWLTMLGIFIGVAAVVSLISLGQGMQTAIQEQFFQLGADKLTVRTKGTHMGPPDSNSDVILTEKDLAAVRRTNGVTLATGRLVESVRVRFNDKECFTFVGSLPEERKERAMVEEVASVQPEKFVEGRALKPGDKWKIVASTTYRDEPKFNGRALSVGDKLLMNGQTVQIVGFFRKTGNPMLDNSFIMNEQAMRELLDIPEKESMIIAKKSGNTPMNIVVADVEKNLRNERNVDEGKEDFEVQTGEQLLDTLSTILSIVTAVLVGIAAVSLLVGGIGIMNTMYTAVLERRREIGIMKAIGARNSDVRNIFLIEAGLLGLVGSSIGILLGAGFSLLVQVIATAALGTTLIQASFPLWLIIGSLLFGFIVGSGAGTFPAVQASKLPPVEALRQ